MAVRWRHSFVLSREDGETAFLTLRLPGNREGDSVTARWMDSAAAPGVNLDDPPTVSALVYNADLDKTLVTISVDPAAEFSRIVSVAWEGRDVLSVLVRALDAVAEASPLLVFDVTEDETTLAAEVIVIDTGEGGGGGSGTVTSVAITGANGISVSGSPITDAGTIALSVDAATLRAHLDVLTSGQIATTLEDYVTATGLSTTLEDYALASSVPTEPDDIGAAAATHSHVIADVTGLQTALDGKAASSHIHSIANVTGLQAALNARLVAANNLSDLPSASDARTNLGLAAVAASGDYGDLANTPTLATVATTGSYNDLSDTPSLGTAAVLDAGVANGAATLDSSGKLTVTQMPSHGLEAHSDWVGQSTLAARHVAIYKAANPPFQPGGWEGRLLVADDLPTVTVAKGGTGATDAATARANLGAIGNASGSGATITGVWVGSQAEYDLLTPSAGVLYFVEEE